MRSAEAVWAGCRGTERDTATRLCVRAENLDRWPSLTESAPRPRRRVADPNAELGTSPGQAQEVVAHLLRAGCRTAGSDYHDREVGLVEVVVQLRKLIGTDVPTRNDGLDDPPRDGIGAGR